VYLFTFVSDGFVDVGVRNVDSFDIDQLSALGDQYVFALIPEEPCRHWHWRTGWRNLKGVVAASSEARIRRVCMKNQVFYLGNTIVRYTLGETWFDRQLQMSDSRDDSNCLAQVQGTDQIIALRDFLNSLDLSGRKLCLVKSA
jgi:hypothetical protein